MTFPLILYRISGWLVTGITIYLAYNALKSKKLWIGKYRFLGLVFLMNATGGILSIITALYLKNNLFLEYFYLPLMFTFKGLFLRKLQVIKHINWLIIICISSYVVISIFNVLNFKNLVIFNSLGSILNTSFFLTITSYILTQFFKSRNLDMRLRLKPDFWFIATMFCFAFIGLISTIITDVSYKAGNNDNVLYTIFITENIINCFIYFGYLKGLKLLNKTP